MNTRIENIADIAKIIIVNRKKSNLSREQLALLAGVGKTVLYDIEHGKLTYKIDTIFKVFSVLNIKINIESPFGVEENE